MDELHIGFLKIKTFDDLHKYMISNGFVDEGFSLYTLSLIELKKLYKERTGKTPTIAMRLPQLRKNLSLVPEFTKEKLEEESIKQLSNIPSYYIFNWLNNNGGYESTNLTEKTLIDEFLRRLNNTSHSMVDVEDNFLSEFREKVKTENEGIVANVLSFKKILEKSEELESEDLIFIIVEYITKELGMLGFQKYINESKIIDLKEISMKHKIKKTISIDEEKKLVLFEYDKDILLCQDFNIIDINLLRNTDFSSFNQGLYNYILVCFDYGLKKEYKIYMAETQPEEIGSKHWNVQSKINSDFIEIKNNNPEVNLLLITAGEMILEEEQLQYNFFSGTIFYKLLTYHCEIVTGLDFNPDTEDQCHYIGYRYFWAPFMNYIFDSCSNNDDYKFFFTEEHLITPESMKKYGLVFDEKFVKKLENNSRDENCNITISITEK